MHSNQLCALKNRVVLTCVLMTQVKNLKNELKYKFCIEKNKFLNFQDINCASFKI